jgi:DnaJ-class molecular chaperone
MDLYNILGVARNASPEEIKKSYKRLSMKHHPDRGGNNDDFIKVQQAYEVLSNSDKRNAYDHPQQANPFGGQQQGQNPFAGTPFEHHFQHGFGQQQQRQTPRNRDINVQADIELAEVLTGKNLIIQYQLQTGKMETVTVDVPAGAKHGDTIQYEGLGDNGHPRYPRGNLLVRIKVKKTKHWERDSDNLITKKDVNVFDLLLGCVILVTTLENKKLELKVPQGTNPGQTFNIPGYGLPNMQTGKRGNMYITIGIDIPKITDKDVLDKIQQLKIEINKGR